MCWWKGLCNLPKAESYPENFMRKIILLVFMILTALLSRSQITDIASLLKAKEVKTDYYEMTEAGSWVLYLPMEFGKSTFSYNQEGAIQKLKEADIARIDLVYSDYPAGQDFSLLNKKRLESLKKVLPKLFTKPGIEFRKIRQTIAKTRKTAETLQHGFFIYFRPKPTKEESKKEIEKLKESLRTGAKVADVSKDETAVDSVFNNWCGTTIVVVDTTGGYTIWGDTLTRKLSWDSNWVIKKLALNEYLKSGLIPEIQLKDYEGWDSVYHIEYKGDCPDYSADYFLYQLADTTVSSVFNRHKWNKAMVIADVTGSMYPYTSQLLQWLKLTMTDKTKRYFLFFNDGDSKGDEDKIIGKTGGIYTVFSDSYDEVEKTIVKAMTNGGGGDAPENNIEALLEAEKLCEKCDSVVMIVDNWAPVKDISLLLKSKKPVKVVVCGVMDRINKDYLKLVRDSKGSLHLIEEDIYTLSEIKEGEVIKIRGINYTLIKGEFIASGSLSL